jgi:hypothetical protein
MFSSYLIFFTEKCSTLMNIICNVDNVCITGLTIEYALSLNPMFCVIGYVKSLYTSVISVPTSLWNSLTAMAATDSRRRASSGLERPSLPRDGPTPRTTARQYHDAFQRLRKFCASLRFSATKPCDGGSGT